MMVIIELVAHWKIISDFSTSVSKCSSSNLGEMNRFLSNFCRWSKQQFWTVLWSISFSQEFFNFCIRCNFKKELLLNTCASTILTIKHKILSRYILLCSLVLFIHPSDHLYRKEIKKRMMLLFPGDIKMQLWLRNKSVFTDTSLSDKIS